jgi:acyl carrier protein
MLTRRVFLFKEEFVIDNFPAFRHNPPMDDLKLEIKKLIVSALELEDIKPENITDAEPIFGAGLGLDSIDALELGVALKKKFGVSFQAESADNKRHFASVNALAAFIAAEGRA